jgi:hypothetical protein
MDRVRPVSDEPPPSGRDRDDIATVNHADIGANASNGSRVGTLIETLTSLARELDRLTSSFAFYPPIVAALPVLALYSNNLIDVPPSSVVVPLLLVVGASVLAYTVLSVLWRAPRRAAIVVSAAAVPVVGFGFISDAAAPYWEADPLVLASLCLVVVGLATVVAIRVQAGLATITQTLNVGSLVVVAAASVPIMAFLAAPQTPPTLAESYGPQALASLLADDDDAGTQRDIYYLVFDRYGSELSLRVGHGISNDEFIGWLRDRGFDVVDDARANYLSTELSLGSTLGMSLLDDIAEQMGPDSRIKTPVIDRIQNSLAGAYLQERGYEYIHIGSWYEPTRMSNIADRSLHSEARVSFASTLYGVTILPLLADPFASIPVTERALTASSARLGRLHAETADYQFSLLEALADEPGPRFVFAHILLPHPPFVFFDDGTFAPGEATFESQMHYTNARIREFIEPLLALPEDERPIIILQADEGPYPSRYSVRVGLDWATATDEELVMKFGILNAMYLPGPEGVPPLPARMSSVNTFREILSRYFGADLPNLPDASFTSPPGHPYDLQDDTDRLDRAIQNVNVSTVMGAIGDGGPGPP